MNTKPNDSATPYVLPNAESEFKKGLSKREYFAGLAMQGLMSNGAFSESNFHDIAKWSTQQADALIKQLNTTNNGE